MNEMLNGPHPRRALHVRRGLAVALFGGFAITLAACPGPTPQTGTGGSGGEGSSTSSSSGGMPCTPPSECLAPTSDCMTPNCDIACGFAPVAANTPCTENGGKLCDGAGQCVACVTTTDCGPLEECVVDKQCNAAGLCENVKLLPQGSGCLSPASGTCDAKGMCVARKYVFVTSDEFTAKFGGAAKADSKCTEVAAAAGLGGMWKSWTSDSGATPLGRFTHSPVPYMLLDDQTVVASNWDGLTDGTLENGITMDEHKHPLMFPSEVWTGTYPDGSYAGSSCNNWTPIDGSSLVAAIGLSGKTGFAWTKITVKACSFSARLYCFQQ